MSLKPLKKTKLNIKLKWYIFLFHSYYLFFYLFYVQLKKKNIPEIEVAAHHLVTAFSDGGSSVCSWVMTGKVSRPDYGWVPT